MNEKLTIPTILEIVTQGDVIEPAMFAWRWNVTQEDVTEPLCLLGTGVFIRD